MIEFVAFQRNPLAPRVFVNDIGSICRLDGGIIELTFVKQFTSPKLVPVEQVAMIWPERSLVHHVQLMSHIMDGVRDGTFLTSGLPLVQAKRTN